MRWLLCVAVVVTGSAVDAWAQPDEEKKPAEDPKVEEAPKTGTITGVVEAPDLDAPLAGASVTVIGTELTATTDEEGRYKLDVPPGTVKLRVDFPGFKSEEQTVTVAAGAIATADIKLATLQLASETIVVVGSRTPRTKVETTAPVDIVTAEEIGRTGRTETGRALHTLAASYISTPNTVADGTDHVDPAALRGLGPDQVLVLVNGKRRHRSALLHLNGTFGRGTVGTDLNAIPIGAIKRIEILRDGAASQYGSDAIAGVINIVTKDVTDLLDVSVTTGVTGSRDGAQIKTTANYGFKVGKQGFVNITGEYLERQATSRSGAYNGTVFSDDAAIDSQMLAASGLAREDFAMKIGEAAAIAGAGAFNMELPFGSGDAKFYSFGDIAHRRGSAAGFYRFPKQTLQNVDAFFPNGFLPEIHPTIDDKSLTIGVRRKGTWTVDASLTHGRNDFKFNIENSVNASLGTSSPTTFDAGTIGFAQTVANLDLLRKLDIEKLKRVSLVLGTELRVESYRIIAGDEPSFSFGGEMSGNPPVPKASGAQVFPGFQPSNEVDRGRDSIGLYGGLETDVTKNITVDVGGRFENYSDFGRSAIGKVAGRVKLAGPLSLRAAASTGFRAPSLHQVWFSNVQTAFLPDATGTLVATQVLTSNNQSPVTRAFGIPALREERSINASAGLTLRPSDDLSITADGYFIRLRDRIVLTSQFTNGNAIVADILDDFQDVSQAQFFANAVDTDTGGLDIVVDYTREVGGGTIGVTGSANFTRTNVVKVNVPASLADRFGSDPAQLRTFFFGRLAENRLEDAVPRVKGTTAVRFAKDGFGALVRANYYGPVRFKPDNSANDEDFGGKVLFDLDVGYQITKNVLLGVGADNLFNTFPDRQVKDANISNGRFVYSRNVTQFGQNGGFYYAKLQLTFF